MKARVEAAPAAWECVLHVLAHAAVRGPASLHDARYVRWARARFPSGAWSPAAEDGAVVASLHARAGADAWALQVLPVLHREAGRLRVFSRRALRDVRDEDVEDVAALHALRALASRHEALVEVVRADVALVAGAYLDAYPAAVAADMARALGGARGAFEDACGLMPALAGVPVYLSSVLGVRGRCVGSTPAVIVGAPLAWNALPVEHAALQAMHERAVDMAATVSLVDVLSRTSPPRPLSLSGEGEPSRAEIRDRTPPSPDRERGDGGVRSEEGEAVGATSRYVTTEWCALRALERLVAGTSLAEAHSRWRARFDLSVVEREASRLGVAEGAVGELVARLRGG